jgi:hypothetical protein
MSRLHPLIRQLRKHVEMLVTQPANHVQILWPSVVLTAITMLASPLVRNADCFARVDEALATK